MNVRIQTIVAALFTMLCFAVTAAAQEKYGTVYFYRDRDTADYPAQMNVLNPEAILYLEGQEFLALSERTFIGFKMPAGLYRLSMKLKGKVTTSMLRVNPGATYYMHITQIMIPTAFQTINQDSFGLVSETIRKCDALKEKKVKIKAFEMIRVNPAKTNW